MNGKTNHCVYNINYHTIEKKTSGATLLARNLQMEAARVWNAACNIHRTIYGRYGCWLSEGAIKGLLKGKYGLHSQSAQAVVETYFECCERTRKLHMQGHTERKYPYRRKRFFTVTCSQK
ncbi:hypothetical protein [Desulfofundulus thermocisternus]|uniref:hypothetical protein n=1 Tax=Desulfofundulus thermocisternus TaxID=42471 RepID=UPI00217E47F3|nr:hypothetical protein [Desulfofundulus thermocisternus]MCS5695397.1 hypothetical protein [Desulfofundulus thermocisternus]